MKNRREIDGLRSIAVLPVILFHAGLTTFSGGFVGVDVFFVISGFLITGIILEGLERGTFSIAEFYERRARRILPALFVVIAACLPFASLWMLPEQLRSFAWSIVSVMLFASNILFWREQGYFAPSAELKPLLHTWSLAVEEQFYLLFPLILMFIWKLGRKWIVSALVIGALVSLGLSEWGWRFAPTANFYLAPFRAWELLAGSLSALVLHRREPYKGDLAAALGLSAIVGSIFWFDGDTPFPGLYATIPVGGTALILVFGSRDTWVAKALSVPPLVGIGLISYSAYLWHQPLFAFARLRSIGEPSQALMLGLVAITLALAWLSWRFVEQPFRKRGHGPVPTRKAVFTSSVIAMSAFAAVGAAGASFDEFSSGFRLPPGVTRDMSERIGEGDCMDRTVTEIAKYSDWFCRRGQLGAATKIGVYGDSHALSFLPALDSWGIKNHVEVRFTAMSTCIPLKDAFVLRRDSLRYDCNSRNHQAFSASAVKDFDAVVLFGRWALYTIGDKPGDFRYVGNEFDIKSDKAASNRAVIDRLGSTARFFSEARIPVILVHQAPVQLVSPEKPYFATTLDDISLDQAMLRTSVSLDHHRASYGRLQRAIDGAVRRSAGEFTTVDLAPILCAGATCRIGDAGHSSWYDMDHLSHWGAARTMPLLAPALTKAIADKKRSSGT